MNFEMEIKFSSTKQKIGSLKDFKPMVATKVVVPSLKILGIEMICRSHLNLYGLIRSLP